MIPLLGIPILNRGDLLERLISSIDYPVKKLYLINNGDDEGVESAIKKIQDDLNYLIGEVVVYKPLKNMGVAASWNHIISQNAEAPYWLICGNDIWFKQHGDLEKMVQSVEQKLETHSIIYASEYSCFFLTKLGLKTVGYFDENIYPAYGEEADHFRRVRLTGATKDMFWGLGLIHGEYPQFHATTINSNPQYKAANNLSHQINKEYYFKKWGGDSGRETFTRPFNNPELAIDFWELDKERRKVIEEIWNKKYEPQ